MANFKCWELEIELEFKRWSFTERVNSSKGPSEPKKNTQVNWVQGRAAPGVFFLTQITYLRPGYNIIIIINTLHSVSLTSTEY